MSDPPKRAAIDLDEMASKRMSEVSAAEFLQALDQAAGAQRSASLDDATLGDVLSGARGTIRLPEKKKVELEKPLLEGFPEKKKVELEKPLLEGFPEKKKVELEKPHFEKQSLEGPDILTQVEALGDRLTQIEQQLSRLAP